MPDSTTQCTTKLTVRHMTSRFAPSTNSSSGALSPWAYRVLVG